MKEELSAEARALLEAFVVGDKALDDVAIQALADKDAAFRASM